MELGLKVKGRKEMPMEVAVVKELSVEDLLIAPEGGAKPPPLQRVRDTHHAVARLVADGLKDVEVSAITGMCQSRISILKGDPAFQELLVFYSEEKRKEYVDIHRRLGLLSAEALSGLLMRLEARGDTLPTKELVSIAKLGLDRSGFGPTSKIEAKVAHFTADDLARMKQELAEVEKGNVKTLTIEGSSGFGMGGDNSAGGGTVQELFGPTGNSETGVGLRAESGPDIKEVD